MEKKIEKEMQKEVEFKLKPESDPSLAPEESVPELVVTESDGAQNPNPNPNPSPNPNPNPNPDTNPEVSGTQTTSNASEDSAAAGNPTPPPSSAALPTVAPLSKKPMAMWLSVRTSLILFLVFACGAMLLPVFKWYSTAPRVERPTSEFMLLAPLAAWVGEPDTAYSMQLVPAMMGEITAGHKLNVSDNHGHSLSPEYRKWLSKTHQRDLALANIDQFLKSSPAEKPFSVVTKATAIGGEGKPLEAAAALRPVADKSENPIMKGYLALFLAMGGDLHNALIEIDKAMALSNTRHDSFNDTSSHSLVSLKGLVLQALGKPEEALALVSTPEADAALKNGFDTILLCKAASYLQMGEPDKAIVLLCQCKQLSHLMLSSAYLMKGDYSEALTHAGTNDFARSRIYSQQGKLDDALSYAGVADAPSSASMVTREQRVYVLNQLKRYKEALSISENLVGLTDLNVMNSGSMQAFVEVHADRAFAFAKLGDAKNALLEADKALSLNPCCRTALQSAQLANELMGNPSAANTYKVRLERLTSPKNFRPLVMTDPTRQQ